MHAKYPKEPPINIRKTGFTLVFQCATAMFATQLLLASSLESCGRAVVLLAVPLSSSRPLNLKMWRIIFVIQGTYRSTNFILTSTCNQAFLCRTWPENIWRDSIIHALHSSFSWWKTLTNSSLICSYPYCYITVPIKRRGFN